MPKDKQITVDGTGLLSQAESLAIYNAMLATAVREFRKHLDKSTVYFDDPGSLNLAQLTLKDGTEIIVARHLCGDHIHVLLQCQSAPPGAGGEVRSAVLN